MEFTTLLTIITEINTQLIRSIIYPIITESENEPLKLPLIKLVHAKMTIKELKTVKFKAIMESMS